jgi:superfamily I DNA/RNA helicase
MPPPADYLARLNPGRWTTVETVNGPLLVLAGAGKMRVLTTRFAHIVLTRRAFPNKVLTVIFTNKAARGMRDRVSALSGPLIAGLRGRPRGAARSDASEPASLQHSHPRPIASATWRRMRAS